jgi:L-fucose mutarotase
MGLLKGLPPLLTADVLHVLRSMGHGDVLCIADANFPAAEVATKTTTCKCIVTTSTLPEMLDAICSVLPLDFFVDSPARCMAPAHGHELPAEGAQALADMQAALSKHCAGVQLAPVERFAFYEEARRSFAVVR